MLAGPPGVLLLVVVFRAEVREIVVVRVTVVLPILRLVEIAAPSGGTASRGPAGPTPHAKPGAELWRYGVAVATEESEHRHRDEHASTDTRAQVRVGGVAFCGHTVDEQNAEDILPQSEKGARLIGAVEAGSDIRLPVVDGLDARRREVGGEPGHAIPGGIDRQLPLVTTDDVPHLDRL